MLKLECYTEPTAQGLSVFLCDQGFKSVRMGKAVITDMPTVFSDLITCALIKQVEPTEHDKEVFQCVAH